MPSNILHPRLAHRTSRESWKRFRAGLLLGVGLAALTALPTFADDEEPVWSPAFLSVLEQWQSRYSEMRLAEYVSDEHPDLMAEWVHQASNALGGSILTTYEDSQPGLVDIYEETYLEIDNDGNVQAEDGSFVDFLIHGADDGTFPELETKVVAVKGRDLATFLAGIDDGAVLAAYQALPQDAPIHEESLANFVADFQDPALDAEAALFASTAAATSTCTCRVLATVTAPSLDVDWPVRVYLPNGTLKEERSWWLSRRGAARRTFSDRYVRNGLNELVTATHQAKASVQLSLSCTRNNNGNQYSCYAGHGCSAEVKIGARYDSYVWVKNEATRTFPGQSFGSTGATMDLYTLIANPAGNRQVLAEKGLALERVFNGNQNALNFVQDAHASFGFTGLIVHRTHTHPLFSALLSSLVNENWNNFFGVLTYENGRAESGHNLASKYSNLGGPAVILPSAGSHKVEMTSYSRTKSRGWGTTSRTRSLVASDYYLVAVANNFTCQSAIPPAVPKIAWSYNSIYQSPMSASSLRAQVDDFILATTGMVIYTGAANGTN